MEEKLRKYGFSDCTIEELIKGKVTIVAYGKVKFDKRTGVLTTFYQNGRNKKEELQERRK